MNALIRFHRGLFGMPLHWQLWLLLLIGANLIAPLFFLERLEALLTVGALFFGMMVMTGLTARFSFSRILGLGHIAWFPLIAFLAYRAVEIPATEAFGLWLRAVIVLNAISLVLDSADVVRFIGGDRAETVSGLDPPLEVAARRV